MLVLPGDRTKSPRRSCCSSGRSPIATRSASACRGGDGNAASDASAKAKQKKSNTLPPPSSPRAPRSGVQPRSRRPAGWCSVRFAAADASAAPRSPPSRGGFWGARGHLFADAVLKTGATQMTGISNALDADIKGARSGGSTTGPQARGGDVVTATLSNEKMHRIFAERPAVRAAFLENVPRNMTEREFWTRFLRSEYFKAARAGAAPQGEQEAADLALFARRPKRSARARRRRAGQRGGEPDDDAGDFGVFGRAGARAPSWAPSRARAREGGTASSGTARRSRRLRPRRRRRRRRGAAAGKRRRRSTPRWRRCGA